MPLPPWLLEIVACPVCRAPLREQDGRGLLCTGCARLYPVREGIPVLLADEATLPSPGEGAR